MYIADAIYAHAILECILFAIYIT